MTDKSIFARTGLIILALLLISVIGVIATETTWRHPGFEVTLYDINFSSTYNITELRKLEWGWHSMVPAISEADRAVEYYNATTNKKMISKNGGAYYEAAVEGAVTNDSVRAVTGANVTGDPGTTTGNLTFVAGANATITRTGTNFTFNSLVGSQTVNWDTFTGNGATQNYSLTSAMITNSSRVYMNGILQRFNVTYTEGAQSINFSGTIPSGYLVEVEYTQS